MEGSFYLRDKVSFFGQKEMKRVGIKKTQISDKFQESRNHVLFLFFVLYRLAQRLGIEYKFFVLLVNERIEIGHQ